MPITFTGLSSGLDTAALVEQLVASERASASALRDRQADLGTQRSIVGSLSTAVAALGTAARGLDLASETRPRTATVSDARLAAAVSPAAAAASHTLRVKQLATAQIAASRTYLAQGAGAAGAGSLGITVGGSTKTVSYTASDSLADIASRISAADAGVSAAVLHDGAAYRLVVTAKGTGQAAAPTFTESGAGLGLALPTSVTVAAQDAIVTIDGIDVARPRNVIADALDGVTLTLASAHGSGDASTQLTVGLDQKALTEKVKGVVAAYNTVNSALHVQLDYTGTRRGSATLFGDSTLRQLQGALAGVMSKSYGPTSLGAIGISRDRTGAMTLDESKLAAAVAADPDAVGKLFVDNGFAAAVGDLADQYTRSGTGHLAAKSTSLSDRAKALQSQIDRINASADSLQSRLEARFTALEEAMSQLRTQSSYLSSITR
jgi:flagellar hook-associated protein 2